MAAQPIAAASAIKLDGELSEEVWQKAPVVSGFRQRDPKEGAAATYETEARVAYDANAIYIAVQALDPEPARIVGIRTRRDESSPSDWIRVMIDSFHDRRSAYEFAVNPAGVKADTYWYNDTNNDQGWDAVWDVAVSRNDRGWRAEFRVPFSQLRFPAAADSTFGLAIVRRDRPAQRNDDLAAAGEERDRVRIVVWRADRPADRPGAEAPRAGPLCRRRREDAAGRGRQPAAGRENGRRRSWRRSQVRAASRASRSRPRSTPTSARSKRIRPSSTCPRSRRSSRSGAPSSSKVVASSSSTSTAATAAAAVSSTRAALAARRAGSPSLGDGEFSDVPAQTTILGAAKLTGRAGGFSIGGLSAITADEDAVIALGRRGAPRDG